MIFLWLFLLVVPVFAAEAPARETELELRAVQAELGKYVLQYQYAERLRQEAEAMLPKLVARENELKALFEKKAEKKK